jgi:hypothetical protein
MKTIFALLFVLTSAAAADPRVDNMVAQCSAVMESGACRVVLDPRDYPNSTVLIAGVGRISTASYLKIRGTGEARNPDGSYRMCTIVREACSVWDSDDCKAARALWKQVAP